MAATNIQSALTEIPLSLNKTDDPENHAAKLKSNSLKRFFSAKGSKTMTSRKSGMATNTTSGDKKTPLFFRFGSFSKSDGLDGPIDDKEPGTSTSKSGAKRSQWSLSNYWTLPFKKASKKSPTKEADTTVDVVPQADVKEVKN